MDKRSGIMLCYPFEERRLIEPKFDWSWPVIVQPKLDGERCRVVIRDNKITLLSSECNEFVSVPHINKYFSLFFGGGKPPEFDGELYLHGLDFPEIHSIVSRKENIHEQSELMQLHIFDFVSNLPQLTRTHQLDACGWLGSGPCKIVPSRIAFSMSEIMIAYDSFIDLGYEGIIIRHIRAPYVRKRSRFMLKFKPRKDDYYKIIGVNQAISIAGEPLSMIGAFQCQGSDGTPFKIGAGKLTHDERKNLWKDRHTLIDNFAHVQYQNITSGGVPRFGLCIDITDKNPEETSGGGIL